MFAATLEDAVENGRKILLRQRRRRHSLESLSKLSIEHVLRGRTAGSHTLSVLCNRIFLCSPWIPLKQEKQLSS